MFQEAFNRRGDGGDPAAASDKKRIHVRSKDPLKIARQLEKKMHGKQSKGSKGVSWDGTYMFSFQGNSDWRDF